MPDVRWTDDLLDRMRGAGDPGADDAIAEVYAAGQAEPVRQALLGFGRNEQAIPDGLPPKLRDYFDRSSVLPDWADPARMERGNDLLGRYEPHVLSTLLCGSLPLCYACANGVQVLHRSQRLTGQVYRRLVETSQFVVDVLDEGGLGADGRGVRSAQKIRLLHATMRYHVSSLGDWDNNGGIPINQEDLAGTLLSFAVVIPLGLQRLGVELPARDRDDFFHIWRVIGHVLGVDERLNPSDFDSAVVLKDRILERQQAPSEAGREMTKALLDFIREVLPGPAFAGVGPSLMRHLAGDRTADILAVPPADWTSLGIQLQSGLSFGYGKTGDKVPLAGKLASEFGRVALKEGLRMTNKGRRYEWQVPTGLTEPS
ncbi:hypothetical protein SAMN05216215_105414 [Saccharopolyspora shandongensis]|uniref:ER-bound oxygenase mpaB/mpaB'/Rubber oxygenase catalytic domain-containing protein n=1 Tax=Saccharopolyspora shandongensis TaxID=418495 RepID=A0A1H3RGD4_9PSEU|nr:oxygenase MpaB family protein [Saccharopolyspora shandongensis]SDZ24892.1 hypothetical protein SAMN05216215_105414 [Saccharopolyspora shandongensis]